ncbi:MAG: iron-containing alcohol dehydrogenase [Lachnospiraceae bacterium]|nr:iron-containing alcohol dehydrogenase [Lachnospiraceae bacterium]
MSFQVKTKILECASISNFLNEWGIGADDLLITNEYVIEPHLNGIAVPCDILYQEQYGMGEPTDEMVDKMLQAVCNKDYKRVIGLGGGTVLDIAKLFVFGAGISCDEIFEQGHKLQKRRELIAIPTTCGTGSEVTMISIIQFIEKNTKLGLATPALYPDEAVLIPRLLSTMPYEVFATGSIDALIHSVESLVSPKATSFSKAMAYASIQMILKGYQKLKVSGSHKLPDEEQLKHFLVASTLGGIAFGNAGVGAVHALSYPVGAIYHVPHGMANYMFFAGVFAAYKEMGADLNEVESILMTSLDCLKENVWNALFELLQFVLPCKRLQDLGVTKADCIEMADSVVKNQQRLLVNNPIVLPQKKIEEIYLRQGDFSFSEKSCI